MLDVALLGTGGMMPLPNRFLTAMLCRVNGRSMLVDCGEGTQVTLKMLGWGCKNIDVLCFTHFHADHISGLPGLLLTIGNAGRTEPLQMFGPPGLAYVIKSLCVIAPELPFPIQITEWEAKKSNTVDLEDIIISTLPLDHRAPCFAYCFEKKRPGKFDLERAKRDGVPMAIWSILQKQKLLDGAIVYENRRYTPDMVLGPPRRGLKLVYCTDTRPVPGLADFAKEADLFICEGLYGEADKQEKTARHKHMSFREAATVAKQAAVGELWLTHFSPAMPDPQNYRDVATDIFPRTVVGRDRMTKTLYFADA